MSRFRRLAFAIVLALHSGSAVADHVDPFAVAQEAAEAYGKNNSYPEVRAIFSRAAGGRP